ncbi:MAG: helix-turn-helix transcriptional regulator [Coriobacteriales bacterium]
MGERIKRGSGPVQLRLFAACLFTEVLLGITTIQFNGSLGAGPVVAAVSDYARDWATLAQAVFMVALALVARARPRAIRSSLVTLTALVLCIVGSALALAGVRLSSAGMLLSGICLIALAVSWATILQLVLAIRLPTRQLVVCFASAEIIAGPLGQFVSDCGFAASLACYVTCTMVALACAGVWTRGQFSEFAAADPASDVEVTSPRSVLPLTHDLFVYILAFRLAYGFGMRYEQADVTVLSGWFSCAFLAAIVVYAPVCRNGPRADVLFDAAFLLLQVGLVLVVLGDSGVAVPASVALTCGATVFSQLMSLSLCAIAARSTSNALPAILWGNALYYAGISVGALLGIVFTGSLAASPLASRLAVAAVLVAITMYTVNSMRDFGFDRTIEGVEQDRPRRLRVFEPSVLESPAAFADRGMRGGTASTRGVSRPQDCSADVLGASPERAPLDYAAAVSARCDELAAQLHLTEREKDVFCLLVRGGNAPRIEGELGITRNTLKYHVRHIYEKAGVHSQQELIDLL